MPLVINYVYNENNDRECIKYYFFNIGQSFRYKIIWCKFDNNFNTDRVFLKFNSISEKPQEPNILSIAR